MPFLTTLITGWGPISLQPYSRRIWTHNNLLILFNDANFLAIQIQTPRPKSIYGGEETQAVFEATSQTEVSWWACFWSNTIKVMDHAVCERALLPSPTTGGAVHASDVLFYKRRGTVGDASTGSWQSILLCGSHLERHFCTGFTKKKVPLLFKSDTE